MYEHRATTNWTMVRPTKTNFALVMVMLTFAVKIYSQHAAWKFRGRPSLGHAVVVREISKMRGTILGDPHNMDCNILGSILEASLFWDLPLLEAAADQAGNLQPSPRTEHAVDFSRVGGFRG